MGIVLSFVVNNNAWNMQPVHVCTLYTGGHPQLVISMNMYMCGNFHEHVHVW